MCSLVREISEDEAELYWLEQAGGKLDAEAQWGEAEDSMCDLFGLNLGPAEPDSE
jgi:hypothetical protein